jgi:transposase
MIHQILELHYDKGLSIKAVARTLGIARNTVREYLRAHEAAAHNGEGAATAAPSVAGKQITPVYSAPWSMAIDWPAVRTATLTHGTKLSHYWEEHLPAGQPVIPYVSFWREYKRRYPEVPINFHKTHPPAERMEIDYKGQDEGLSFVDRRTGEITPCRLYGAVLCFSQLLYVEPTLTERQEDWLGATAHALEYFGGVPKTLAHDNPKAITTRADRFDPDHNPEFYNFCSHYNMAPLACRPARPTDKNLIENALGVFWRWAGPKIRAQLFFSLGELRTTIRALVDEFNGRITRKYGLSRRARFSDGEQALLMPLPGGSYEGGTWKKAVLHPDSHLQVGYNFYSAPHALRDQTLDVRLTQSFVEIFHRLERLAVHRRLPDNQRGRYTTIDAHLPEAHRALREATPQWVVEQATRVGPATAELVKSLIEQARHPLMHLRRAQGILRLGSKAGRPALETACAKLLELRIHSPRMKDVEAILKNNSSKQNQNNSAEHVARRPNPLLRGQHTWSAERGYK